jgi:hypothetical protein
MDYLSKLENQSIYILREAYAKLENLAMLWSIGKDSTVLLWLARKAFCGHVPFPLVHVDTTFKTKNELGFDYGMKASSAIGKEWFEQADAFAKYVTGKKVADVSGISLTEGAPASGTELASSVTVHVTDMISVVEKAQASSAK